MKEILLSHDSRVLLYSVPDEAADHLEEYCSEFSENWIWKNPNGAKYLKKIRGQTVAFYGAPDFIDYLNTWIFPEQQSKLIRQLDFYSYEQMPETYSRYPWYNF